MNNILAVLVSYNSLSNEEKELFKQVINFKSEDESKKVDDLLKHLLPKDYDIFKKQGSVVSQPYIQPFSIDKPNYKSSMICHVGGESID